jgi:hypothetical protein
MRMRVGTYFGEAHGRPYRCYDWCAPLSVAPSAIPGMAEEVWPGLRLEYLGDGAPVTGFVLTSQRRDCRYVSLQLYDWGCWDDDCPYPHFGHRGERVHFQQADPVPDEALAEIRRVVGEHPQLRLRNDGQDDRLLSTLGFRPWDGPRLRYGTIASGLLINRPSRSGGRLFLADGTYREVR